MSHKLKKLKYAFNAIFLAIDKIDPNLCHVVELNIYIIMVRTDSKTETIKNIYQRNTSDDWKNGGSGIVIESSFQRGDEETGVWTREFQQKYIDSLQKGYPSGIITFVKDHNCATAYQYPWKVLDGGNRMRAIKDYKQDKYVDLNGKKYSQLTSDERANFDTILIPCQEITIERTDPDKTIADMFIRLNTKVNPLRQGELFKAHGYRSDVWQIEMSKKLIGDNWTSTFEDTERVNDIIDIASIHELWDETLGKLGETNRCDSLAMILGYITSACTDNFTLFDKRYSKLCPHLDPGGSAPAQEDYAKIYGKLWLFLDILSKITDKSIFGRITNGIPPQSKIAPVWKKICEGTLNESDISKMIRFYNSLSDDSDLKDEYFELFKGSNCETGTAKIQKIVDFVLTDRN